MNKAPETVRKELAFLAAMPEDDIDLSDIPETDEIDWENASRGRFYKPRKTQLTVRIDADVLDWLKSQGKGFHTRLNQILRSAMIADLRSSK